MCLRTRAPRFEVLRNLPRPVISSATSEFSFSSPDSQDYGTIYWMMALADTLWIVDQAKSLGFDLCGVVRAEQFPELKRMPEWLARGYAGEMKYLADPRRADPQTAMPGIRSAIVGLLNYNTAQPLSTDPALPIDDSNPRGWISRYAWGDDYHDVLRERLDALVEFLRERFKGTFEARSYVDTGPVQERVLAKYAGLGWLGKNTLLLNQMLGSYFFLGVILTTLDLEPTLGANELPPPDLCGSCRRCLDACPTQAFVEPYVMDARKCISYLTIELRGAIPEEFREPMGNHVFGCDICQDVCPWNRRAPIVTIPQFQPRGFPPPKENHTETSLPPQDESLYLPRLEWLLGLSEADFRELFRGSPVKRTKWRGLIRNACIALGNSRLRPGTAAHDRISDLLERLAASQDQVLAESARWALSRIQ
jgi:epoxyqueuosine reductase